MPGCLGVQEEEDDEAEGRRPHQRGQQQPLGLPSTSEPRLALQGKVGGLAPSTACSDAGFNRAGSCFRLWPCFAEPTELAAAAAGQLLVGDARKTAVFHPYQCNAAVI